MITTKTLHGARSTHGLMGSLTHLNASRSNWKRDKSDLSPQWTSSRFRSASSSGKWSTDFCVVVLRGTLMRRLLPHHMKAKERWTDLYGMHVIPTALNVSAVWANIPCLLPQTIPARYLWSLRTLGRLLYCSRLAVIPFIRYYYYTRDTVDKVSSNILSFRNSTCPTHLAFTGKPLALSLSHQSATQMLI